MKAKELLSLTSKAPRMFCHSKEALMSRVVTVLEMVDIDFLPLEFYKKHLDVDLASKTFTNLKDDYDNEWASKVIDDALSMIKDDI